MSVAVTLVLLSIIVSNQYVAYLAKAAQGDLNAQVIGQLLLLGLPVHLGVLLPLGLYLGIVLAFGRLYAEQEMAIVLNSHFGISRVVTAIMAPSIFIVLLVAVLNLWVNPRLLAAQSHVIAEAEANASLQVITPGRFQVVSSGGIIVYAEQLMPDGGFRNVFVTRQSNGQSHQDLKSRAWDVIYSKKAHFYLDKRTRAEYIILEQGNRYQGTAGSRAVKSLAFDQYWLRVKQRSVQVHTHTRATSTWALWQQPTPKNISELQWRISVPISIPILVLVAVGLSRVRPRQGKYAKFLPALLVFIVYYNLLIVSKAWVEGEVLMPDVGLWWVHIGMLLVAVLLLRWQFGSLSQKK